MNFSSKDFSVIIQGPIIGKKNDHAEKQLSQECIKSIRKYLPDSEIIISTWIGEQTDHLDFDKIVFNEDPGAITYNDYELKNVYNNNNRQIISTYKGLKLASRKYAIKIRADFRIENTNFFNFIGKYTNYNKYPFFKQRIIVSTYFSRNPEKTPLLYHISDLFQIGLTEDLTSLWNIDPQPEPQTTRALPYSKTIWNDPFRHNKYKMRYASEQYIWYAFTKKMNLDLTLNYFSQVPIRLISKATVSVIDNFIILSPEQIGLCIPDRLMHGEKKLYTYKDWYSLYEKICVKKSKIRLIKLVFKVKIVSLNYVFRNFVKNIILIFKTK